MRACKPIGVTTCCAILATGVFAQQTALKEAHDQYESGEYGKAIETLKSAASKEGNNGDIYLLLTRAYLELKRYDAAVSSGEKAVAINPTNSEYHRWLGQAYGEKADHSSVFSAYPLARKTQKEFEMAAQLDERNFPAIQDLVEFDCTAPSIVGGGEDKAQAIIQKLMQMDDAEAHYAAGICRAVKKDFAAADAEFAKALDGKLKSADRIFGVADYFAQRNQGEKVLAAADAAKSITQADARTNYYQGVGFVAQNEELEQAEKLLRQYLHDVPEHPEYPKSWEVHYWLGRLHEARKNESGARSEYETALKLNAKYKKAQEGLKQLGSR